MARGGQAIDFANAEHMVVTGKRIAMSRAMRRIFLTAGGE
jgi:hypothetical protein